MEFVAIRENLGRKALKEKLARDGESFGAAIPDYVTPEFVRQEVALGRAIIPANINHPETGANGDWPQFSGQDQRQYRQFCRHSLHGGGSGKNGLGHPLGADTVMDLSTGRNIHNIRDWIIRNAPVPIGTVPLYQALERWAASPKT